MKVRYTPRAVADLEGIYSYIFRESPAAAIRTVDRIESVATGLADIPAGGARTDKAGIRRFPVAGTPYLIFYEVLGGEISIAHIRHGARRPWAGQR
jgi:toxin ParE1/3/4